MPPLLSWASQPLLPWNPRHMWYPRGSHTSRREVWIDPFQGDYDRANPSFKEASKGEGNCWSSKTTDTRDNMHLPILDIDWPYKPEQTGGLKKALDYVFGGVPQVWVPSTNNWHVYIGAGPGGTFDAAIPWQTLRQVLTWLANAEIVDSKWAHHCEIDEQCIARKPNEKGSKDLWSCMWCAAEADTKEELEAHEEVCVTATASLYGRRAFAPTQPNVG